MFQLLPDRVHLSGQPSLGSGLYPLIQQFKQIAPQVGGGGVPRHQEIGQFLARTLHQKLADFFSASHAGPWNDAALSISAP